MYGSEHFVTLFIDYHHTILKSSFFRIYKEDKDVQWPSPTCNMSDMTELKGNTGWFRSVKVSRGLINNDECSHQDYMYLDKSFIFTKE